MGCTGYAGYARCLVCLVCCTCMLGMPGRVGYAAHCELGKCVNRACVFSCVGKKGLLSVALVLVGCDEAA